MNPITLLLLVAFGACVGSFAVTAGMRMAAGRKWAGGRSRCDQCAVHLPYSRSVPVVSYALSRGRCGACRAAIPPLHPAAEVGGAVLLPMCLIAFEPVKGVLIFLLAMVLLAGAVVDLKTLRLPDPLTATAGVACLTLAAIAGVTDLAVGLGASAMTLLILQGLRFVAQRRGRDPGLGFGDVKLMGALAIWLGMATPWAVLLAAAAGLVVILVSPPASGRLPFGPFIAAAGLFVGILHDAGLLGLVA